MRKIKGRTPQRKEKVKYEFRVHDQYESRCFKFAALGLERCRHDTNDCGRGEEKRFSKRSKTRDEHVPPKRRHGLSRRSGIRDCISLRLVDEWQGTMTILHVRHASVVGGRAD